MKIAANKIFSMSTMPYKVFLLYGENQGKVDDCIDYITKTIGVDVTNGLSIVSLPFKDVSKDVVTFLDLASTLSFNVVKQLIRIVDVEANISQNLEKAIASVDCNNTYIILSARNNLPANSSTRKYFEKLKNCAVVPCYNDEGYALEDVIRGSLDQHCVSYDKRTVALLAYYLKGERNNIYSEIEKLVAYIGEKRDLCEQDILDSGINNLSFDIDALTFAIAYKNKRKALYILAKIDANLLAVLRSLSKYFIRLYYVVTKINDGVSCDVAVCELNPKLFFKHVNTFKEHIRLWKVEQILALLKKTLEVEVLCKSGDVKGAKVMFKHAIMRLDELAAW